MSDANETTKSQPTQTRGITKTHIVLTASAVLAGVLALNLPSGEVRESVNKVTWQFGKDRQKLSPFDPVPMYEGMRLQLDLEKESYVYVVSFDHHQGTIVYFPSDYLGTDHKDARTGRMNLLSAGQHDLPGRWEDHDAEWFVPNISHETLSLCVVISDKPLTELEASLKLCIQVGNTAFPDKSMGNYMPRTGKDSVIGKRKLPHEVLRAAMNQAGSVARGRMDVWAENDGVLLKCLNVRPSAPKPGATLPGNPYEKQIRGVVKDKYEGDSPAKPGK